MPVASLADAAELIDTSGRMLSWNVPKPCGEVSAGYKILRIAHRSDQRSRWHHAHSREPQAYIADVIARIASDWPASRWNELMPWNWTADRAPISLAA